MSKDDGWLTVQSTTIVRVCAECGAVVGDQKRHAHWHAQVPAAWEPLHRMDPNQDGASFR